MATSQPTKSINFKAADDVEVALDVYLPSNAQNVPILLWFHGGGLLQGCRTSLAPFMRRAVHDHNMAVVSADYRLCPQVSVAEVLDDVLDAISFVRTQLPSHLPSGAIDATRLAVSGSSAGGYLSLLAGLYAEPKPNAILPIYPIADPFGTFFTNPQPPPMGRPLVSKEELASFLDPSAKPQASSGSSPQDPRGNMYVYMMSAANLAQLYHLDRKARADEAEKFRIARNVYQRRLPPAYFLHGDADTCVGVEQADEVVGAMLGCGLEVVYERVRGKDHFLDTGDDYTNEAFFKFLLKHV